MNTTIEKEFNAASERYDSNRRKLIPCFDDFYGTILEQIPAENRAPKVLDIGAGTGLLSEMVLEQFPEAEITLIDIADEMLEKARERFGESDRISYITADYSSYNFAEQYDVIVSALSIHHLKNDQKAALYQTVHSHLNSGGIFVNGDQFLGATEESEQRNQQWWRTTIENAGINLVELDEWETRTAMDIPATVNDNLNWLNQAGFRNADILYKMYNFGVIVGQK